VPAHPGVGAHDVDAPEGLLRVREERELVGVEARVAVAVVDGGVVEFGDEGFRDRVVDVAKEDFRAVACCRRAGTSPVASVEGSRQENSSPSGCDDDGDDDGGRTIGRWTTYRQTSRPRLVQYLSTRP
jgi:hypothetical protein